MLTAIQLKEKLISKIKDIKDSELLWTLWRVITFEEQEIYEMSPEEVEAVNEDIQQIENGQWISHEEANRRIDGFLKKNTNN